MDDNDDDHEHDRNSNETDESQNDTMMIAAEPQSRKRNHPNHRRLGGEEHVLPYDPSSATNNNDEHHDHDHTSNPESFMELLLNPNFEELSRQFPYFRHVYQKRKFLPNNASNHHSNHNTIFTPELTMALSRALLHLHFGLSMSLPELPPPPPDRNNAAVTSSSSSFRFLCPPIPNRFYYVQWIVQTLLPLRTSSLYFEKNEMNAPISGAVHRDSTTVDYVYGLDIGTGATCIYPLLFSYYNKKGNHSHATNHNRRNIIIMHGTDIDTESVQVARTNVVLNQLQSYIHIHLVPKSSRQQHQLPAQQYSIDGTNNNINHHNNNTMIIDHNDDSERDSGNHTTSDQSQPAVRHPVGGPLLQSLQCIAAVAIPPTHSHHRGTLLSSSPPPQFDFIMTNPPFYDTIYSTNELDIADETNNHITRTTSTKQFPQRKQNLIRRTTCMTTNEGYYPEGEVGFGLDLIVDSWNLFVVQHSDRQHSQSRLPHWISMMCGKKSTFTYLQHVLYQLLGPAHICTTEFGPGDHTRWFLAWTYHRPVARSPLALLPKNSWSFAVSVSMNNLLTDGTPQPLPSSTIPLQCQEVANRFVEYCRMFPTLDHGVVRNLICEEIPSPQSDISQHPRTRRTHGSPQVGIKLQIYEREHDDATSLSWIGDESLPECVQQILKHTDSFFRRSNLLPSNGGHFMLDITLSAINSDTKQGISNSNHREVQVRINGYCHSLYGQMTMDKIKSQLQNDICRTSRRWRRLIQQQEQEKSNKASMDVSIH